MSLEDLFKLEKLKIAAYSDRAREKRVSTVEAMFNPESLSQDYEVEYSPRQALNSVAAGARFTMSKPQTMTIDLLLDGTRVDSIGLLAPLQKSVSERVTEFLAAAYHKDGGSDEPNFLILQWGQDLTFECRLRKLTVAYTSFDRGGNPLRAMLTVTLVSDAAAETIAKTGNGASLDVTHTRDVIAGDTLPQLAQEIYGSADHYLFIAAANQLDNFRNLAPGQALAFPPLEPR